MIKMFLFNTKIIIKTHNKQRFFKYYMDMYLLNLFNSVKQVQTA